MQRLILTALIALGTLAAHGQVRLLWRTSVTNVPLEYVSDDNRLPGTNYMVMKSAVDSMGNAVVAGFSRLDRSFGGDAGLGICFVMKFDPAGKKLWETQFSTNCSAGVDDMEIDGQDRIVVSARLTPSPVPIAGPRPVSLIQLSPSGTELWRKTEEYAPGSGFDYYSFSALKFDTQDNILFTYATQDPPAGPAYGLKLSAAKFATSGTRLWKTTLPVNTFIVRRGDMSQSMIAAPDGGMIVAASEYSSGNNHLIKINSRGRIDWRVRGKDVPDVSSMALGRFKPQLCVGAFDGVSFLNTSRGYIYSSNSKLNAVDVIAPTIDNAFLIWNGINLAKVNGEGRQLWTANTGFYQAILGAVPDAGGGWIAAGSATYEGSSQNIVFKNYDNNGFLRWQTNISGFSYQPQQPYTRNFQAVHRAQDGTLRVVANETYSYYPYNISGIGIYSYAIDR